MDLWPVFLWKRLVGQHVFLGPAHQLGELRVAGLEGVDKPGPAVLRRRQRILIEGCAQRGGDDRAALLADASQRVAQGVHAAALGAGPHLLGGSGLQPLVIVRDDRLYAPKATVGQGLKEIIPEYLSLSRL